MKLLLISIILLCSKIIYGQESKIYRTDGKLIIDSTYSINSQKINDFINIEKYVLPLIFNRLEYQRFLAEMSIEGLVIAKVAVGLDNTISVKIIKSVDPALSKAVISAMDTAILIRELKEFSKPFEFYLPFKFVVLDDTFQEDLKTNNSIVIRASSGTPFNERIPIIRKK